jgi:hypothetical protein
MSQLKFIQTLVNSFFRCLGMMLSLLLLILLFATSFAVKAAASKGQQQRALDEEDLRKVKAAADNIGIGEK